jgi:flagellar biosynthesis protein FlhB
VVVRGGDDVAREILERGRNARVRLLFDPVLLDRLYGAAIPGAPLNEVLGEQVLAVLERRR